MRYWGKRMGGLVLIALFFQASTVLKATPLPPIPEPRPRMMPDAAPSEHAASPIPLQKDQLIEKANAFLNSIRVLTADFIQTDAREVQTSGILYIQKPGRLRFEYAPPTPLQIIADGTSVAVRDRDLATQDLYYISQTPLKFLVKDQIDLTRDVKITHVEMLDASTAMIGVEDKETFGGVSHIRLLFSLSPFTLKQWIVTDPQGFMIRVSLSHIDLTTPPNPNLFKIDQERLR